jgi:sugar phosphate isomerase/epimerase
MNKTSTDRRMFLRRAVAAAGAAAVAGSVSSPHGHAEPKAAVGPTHPVRLGGPVFNAPADPEGLALAHRKLGYRAAYCPGVRLSEPEKIRDVAAAFKKHDVVIAEVGRWVNLLDADPAKREVNLKAVTKGLALAEAVGARCCVDIAGSYNPKSWFGPHPDNLTRKFFDAAVENARKIIDAVKPRRAKLAWEVLGWALPDSPDSYLKMIKAIDRESFGVHLDPCNAINCPERYYRNTDLLYEFFDKLGPWIASCHAKDIAWSDPVEMQVHLLEVIPGRGVLDYATWLKRLAALPGDVPLMIEHLNSAEEYGMARRYIMDTGGKAGVRFE